MQKDLAESWRKLQLPEDGAYEALLFRPDLGAKFLLGINHLGNRCFLLEERISAAKQFSAIRRDNITLQWDSTNKVFVLELIDEKFSGQFDELIFSILNKVEQAGADVSAAQIYLQTIREWIDFFEQSKRNLSFEELLGLFGELIVLRRLLGLQPGKEVLTVRGWKGPLKDPRDFVFSNLLLEVKTNVSPKSLVSITNELQLDYPGSEQNLYLALVEVSVGSEGKSIKDLVEEISSILRTTKDGMRIFLSLLQHIAGDVLSNVEYENHRFALQALKIYNAGDLKFPAIRKSELPYGISKTKYLLEMTACEAFRIPNHPLSL